MTVLHGYEGVLVLHPETTLEDQKTLFQQNRKIIKEYEGKLHHCDTWGRRNLANPIKNIKMALFFHYTFYANNKAIAELERTLRINGSVLKFLHTRLDQVSLGQISLEKYLRNYYMQLEAIFLKEKEREHKRLERRKERETQQKGLGVMRSFP